MINKWLSILILLVVVVSPSYVVQNVNDNPSIYANTVTNFYGVNTTINELLNGISVSIANTSISISPLDVSISSTLSAINDTLQFPETPHNEIILLYSKLDSPYPPITVDIQETFYELEENL